jgi:hypothetical protein
MDPEENPNVKLPVPGLILQQRDVFGKEKVHNKVGWVQG